MLESYSVVLGGVALRRPEQVSSVVFPVCAGSTPTVNLMAVTDAVLVPSVTVPVQVPLPLMVTPSGPLAANCVSAMARTAASGSLAWADCTQSFLSGTLSLVDAVMLQ